MHQRQDNDLVADRTEVHGVRKATHERAPSVTLHTGIGERILENRGDRCFDGRGEDGAETDPLSLIPRSSTQ
jgi:hypothetical protein